MGIWRDILSLTHFIDWTLAWHGYQATRTHVLEQCLQAAKALSSQVAIAWTKHQLGTWALCYGQAEQARKYLIEALRGREKLPGQPGIENTRHNLKTLEILALWDFAGPRKKSATNGPN